MKIKICNASTLVKIKDFDLAAAIRTHSECFVGRSPDVALVLDSDDVSRQHGKFYLQDDQYCFCDLGSSNGSVINDLIVEPNRAYSLNNGNALHIGDFVLLVEEQQQELAQTVFKVIDPWMFKPKPPEIPIEAPATNPAEINNLEEIDALPPAVVAIESIESADDLMPNISTAAQLNPIDESSIQTEHSVATPVQEIEHEVTPAISAEVPFDPSTQTLVQTGYSASPPVGEVESASVIDAENDRDFSIVDNLQLEPLPFDPSTQTLVQRGYPASPPVETSIASLDNLMATNEVETIPPVEENVAIKLSREAIDVSTGGDAG